MTGSAPSRSAVAVDAMGSDRAPAPEVGAALACRARGQPVSLVGDQGLLIAALAEAGEADGDAGVDIVHAPGRVGMDADVAMALRRTPDASVRVAARLVADRRATAMVSAGSTGAVIGAALLDLGRCPGVRRPGVSAVLPVPGTDGVVLIDAGGSPDVPVQAVVGFAQMGVALAAARGTASPRVGLLNVGAESGRGNAATRRARAALASVAGFVGNVEPGDVLAGVVDVVVTDAFTGNVFLKTVEAAAAAAGLVHQATTGALLLGARGTVVVAHGAADVAAVDGAVATAADAASRGLAEAVAARLSVSGEPTAPGAVR